MAPEMFSGITYSKPIDIWSVAMMMYTLFSNGIHPLYDPKKDNAETYVKKLAKP